jgi:hypothetical protein
MGVISKNCYRCCSMGNHLPRVWDPPQLFHWDTLSVSPRGADIYNGAGFFDRYYNFTIHMVVEWSRFAFPVDRSRVRVHSVTLFSPLFLPFPSLFLGQILYIHFASGALIYKNTPRENTV